MSGRAGIQKDPSDRPIANANVGAVVASIA
jgi:hypothetical protein